MPPPMITASGREDRRSLTADKRPTHSLKGGDGGPCARQGLAQAAEPTPIKSGARGDQPRPRPEEEGSLGRTPPPVALSSTLGKGIQSQVEPQPFTPRLSNQSGPAAFPCARATS